MITQKIIFNRAFKGLTLKNRERILYNDLLTAAENNRFSDLLIMIERWFKENKGTIESIPIYEKLEFVSNIDIKVIYEYHATYILQDSLLDSFRQKFWKILA